MTALLRHDDKVASIMEIDRTTCLPEVPLADLLSPDGKAAQTLHIEQAFVTVVQSPYARLPGDADERKIYQSREARAPEMVLTRLKNCYWVPELGFLVSQDGKVWRQSTLGQYFDPHFTSLGAVDEIPLSDGTIQSVFHEDRLANVPVIQGLHLLTSHYASTNYGHFLLDMVPIIALGQDKGLTMLTRPLAPWQAEIYVSMGIEIAGIRQVADPVVFLQDVIISNRHNAESTHCAHPEHVAIFANILASIIARVPILPQPRGIFLMRRESKTRHLANRKKLAKELSKLGLDPIYPEDYSFEEQALMLSTATIVVSEFGALLANIAFCQQNTPIIEIIPEGQNDPWSVNMCAALQLEHIVLFQPVKSRHREVVTVGGRGIDNIYFKYKADIKNVLTVVKAVLA